MLKFAVTGSQPEPYIVTFDGVAPDVRAFCTCPAGRKAARFCKHIKFAVAGGPQLLRDESDSHDRLLELVAGTDLEAFARAYVPPPPKPSVAGCASIFDVDREYRRSLETLGFVVELVLEEGPFPSERLDIYKRFKNGNVRKQPSFSLSREELAFDWVEQPDGSSIRANPRPRVRPYCLHSEKRQPKTWSNIDLALAQFLEDVGLIV